MLPVEAFTTGIKYFDRQKVCVMGWLFPSEALHCLVSVVRSSNCSRTFLIFFFSVPSSPWSLDRLSKRALIMWFYFDPDHKRFNTEHVSDYLLMCYAALIWGLTTPWARYIAYGGSCFVTNTNCSHSVPCSVWSFLNQSWVVLLTSFWPRSLV